MDGVVPTAGRGTRFRHLTADRPEPLVEVGGRPLPSSVLETLSLHGEPYVVVVGYRDDEMRERFGDRHDGTPITCVEQDEPAGLADATLPVDDVAPERAEARL